MQGRTHILGGLAAGVALSLGQQTVAQPQRMITCSVPYLPYLPWHQP